MYELVALQ